MNGISNAEIIPDFYYEKLSIQVDSFFTVWKEVYSFGIQKSRFETKLYTLYTLYT